VVRQATERVRNVITACNKFLQTAVEMAFHGDAGVESLPAQLEMIFSDFVSEDDRHRHSARQGVEAGKEPRIELF
jgi:5-methylcytosine-specific restriction endonuclease McrBC regulatory subunit McrC